MLCSKQHCAFKFHVINGQNRYDQIMSDKMSKRANQITSDGTCVIRLFSVCILFILRGSANEASYIISSVHVISNLEIGNSPVACNNH